MIQVKELTMLYGPTLAVDRASFEVGSGTILGLLGPNGAGKSTIMNILTTQMAPTSGTAVVGGFDVREQPLEVRRRLGYLPEAVPLYTDMEVIDYLRFVASGRQLHRDIARRRMDFVVEACGLRKMLRKQIHELSKGYRQRVGIAQALIHDPEILILDEPTSGLDPLQIIGIRDLIVSLARDKTIVISTHILQEISALSDRTVVINEGKIIFDGTLAEMAATAYGDTRYVIVVKGDADQVEKGLRSIDGVDAVERSYAQGGDGCVRFEITCFENKDVLSRISAAIRDNGWLIREFTEVVPTLEEAFISLTRSTRKSVW